MRGAVFPLVLLLACHGAASAAAPGGGPAACRDALAALHQREEQMLKGDTPREAGRQALRTARLQAARACLGGEGEAPPPAQTAVPPVQVKPIAPLPPASGRAVSPAPRPAAPTRPMLTITSCDPGGCWASDGTRLNRMGSVLVGPRGTCTAVGAVLDCR
ncbi:MAG: hypothetical protein AB1430_23500 [Pseudomonadota bacterium]